MFTINKHLVFVISSMIPATLCAISDVATWMDHLHQFRAESCICSADENPVCSSDGRMYRNNCEFQCRNQYLASGLEIVDMKYCVVYSIPTSRPFTNTQALIQTSTMSTLTFTQRYALTSSLPLTMATLLSKDLDESIKLHTGKLVSSDDLRVSSISASSPLPLYIVPQFLSQLYTSNLINWTPEYCLCRHANEPVCGTDGITYENVCEFKCRNQYLGWGLIVAKFGKCDGRDTKTKPLEMLRNEEDSWNVEYCLCPPLKYPVCASDGRTYNSICEFKCRNQYVGWSLTITKLDTCKVKHQSPRNLGDFSVLGQFKSFVDSWKIETCGCDTANNPLCATDGVTYKNLCEFKCRNQFLGWELLIVKFDHCETLPYDVLDNEVANDKLDNWKLLGYLWKLSQSNNTTS